MSDYPNIPGHTIKKCIGKGGMGEVYLGVQNSLGRSVALKVTLASLAEHDENFAERFVREAKTTGRLRHPNIITVYDTGEVGDRCFMTMEYIEGGSLKEKIKEACLDHEQILTIAKGVCAGLGHAHKAGFVHRDIKPENILLTVDGSPVVMDFGIVKVLQSDVDLTGTHAVGSPKYMSPEQLMGDSLVDGRADLYSLGVVIFEMLEGKPPFDAEAAYAIGVKHLNDAAPDLSPVNQRFQPVISRLLEKDREDRFRTAGALLEVLNRLDVAEIGGGIDSTPTPSPAAQRAGPIASTDDDPTDMRAARQSPRAHSTNPPRRPNIHDVSNPVPGEFGCVLSPQIEPPSRASALCGGRSHRCWSEPVRLAVLVPCLRGVADFERIRGSPYLLARNLHGHPASGGQGVFRITHPAIPNCHGSGRT